MGLLRVAFVEPGRPVSQPSPVDRRRPVPLPLPPAPRAVAAAALTCLTNAAAAEADPAWQLAGL
jgi:hypothetical protein